MYKDKEGSYDTKCNKQGLELLALRINQWLSLNWLVNTLNIVLRLRSQSHSSYHMYHAVVGLGLRQLNNATSALEGVVFTTTTTFIAI